MLYEIKGQTDKLMNMYETAVDPENFGGGGCSFDAVTEC